MNPVLPKNHFVPDSEARVMPDGRLYVYGSYDLSGNMSYCSDILHVFSTDDLVNWTDHGVSFSTKCIPWAKEDSLLYAPDCIHRNGKYYLYFCLSDGAEGVAVSNFPYGPFENAEKIDYASGDGIDPAIFVDDDGRAYYYWGQFSLRAAEMSADMKTLKKESVILDLIDEKRHGFHEGASVRKFKDTYILLYTCILRGKATCLAHATAKHPLGPYVFRGIVIDNIGVDPETWNNHGSIECFDGNWYVFYHRSSQNSPFNRRLCIEKINISDDGYIEEALPTSSGVDSPLCALNPIPASSACRLGGWGAKAFIAPDPFLQNEEVIQNAEKDGWAVFRYIDFSESVNRFTIEYASNAIGTLDVWAGDCKIATVSLEDTLMRYCDSSSVSLPFQGICTLYLEWHLKEGSAKFRIFRFSS